MKNKFHHRNHCVFMLSVHLVFVTKYPRKIFDGRSILSLRNIFSIICKDFDGRLIEMDGEKDHVHLLVEYPPKVSISCLVNHLKGISSRLIRKERFDIRRRYWKEVLWSPSYFASSCGGTSTHIVRQYIERQKTPF